MKQTAKAAKDLLDAYRMKQTAKAAKDLLDAYRMKLLWLPASMSRKKQGNGHPGLYLAGVTAKMANDILAGHLVFMPAPRMSSLEVQRIERKKLLARSGPRAHHVIRSSGDDFSSRL